MHPRKPPTREEAATDLKAAAERLFEIAKMPVNMLAQHQAMSRAHRALDDYQDASQRDRMAERNGT